MRFTWVYGECVLPASETNFPQAFAYSSDKASRNRLNPSALRKRDLAFSNHVGKSLSLGLLSLSTSDCFKPGMGKHFLLRAPFKILLLPRAACSYYIYYMYNRFENFKNVLHELP